MKTSKLSLGADVEEFVRRTVSSGRYASASELVLKALQLLKDEEYIRDIHRKELQKKIDAGRASLAHKKGLDGKAFFQKLQRREKSLRRGKRV